MKPGHLERSLIVNDVSRPSIDKTDDSHDSLSLEMPRDMHSKA